MANLIKFKSRKQRDLSKPFVRNSHIFALGFGDLGYSLVSCTVSTYIMVYGTMVAGVSPLLMGIAVAIGTIFDAISDPIVGYLSDNMRNKIFGKRHLFMLIGLIGLMATSMYVWYVPMSISMIGKFFWFATGLTLLRLFNTFYFTPVCAFSVEVSNDYNERTTIQAVRSVFYIIGMILPVIIMATFQNKYAERDALGNIIKKGQFFAQGYIDFAWVAFGICAVTSLFLLITTFSDIKMIKERDERNHKLGGVKKTLKQVVVDFFSVLKIGNMRSIIFGYSIAMVSATLIISIGFHVFTYTFVMSTTQMYVLMGGLLGCTIAGQPIWMKLAKKYDKKTSMIIGLCVSFVGCILIFVAYFCRLDINNLIAKSSLGLLTLLPALMIAGLGTGVLYSMPLALIGDIVEVQSADGSQEQTGTYAGMMTFAYKISQSLTTLVAGALLTAIGFVENSPSQSPDTSSKLGLILCIGITVAVAIGIIIFSTMKIDKKQITEIMAHKQN